MYFNYCDFYRVTELVKYAVFAELGLDDVNLSVPLQFLTSER